MGRLRDTTVYDIKNDGRGRIRSFYGHQQSLDSDLRQSVSGSRRSNFRHSPQALPATTRSQALAIISSQRTNPPSYSSLRCNMDVQSGPARFSGLFEPALQAYEKNTGITLAEHPLAQQLRSCHSIESITSVLLGEAKAYGEFGGSDRVNKSIKNTVSILSTLFATASLDEAIDLVRQTALMGLPDL